MGCAKSKENRQADPLAAPVKPVAVSGAERKDAHIWCGEGGSTHGQSGQMGPQQPLPLESVCLQKGRSREVPALMHNVEEVQDASRKAKREPDSARQPTNGDASKANAGRRKNGKKREPAEDDKDMGRTDKHATKAAGEAQPASARDPNTGKKVRAEDKKKDRASNATDGIEANNPGPDDKKEKKSNGTGDGPPVDRCPKCNKRRVPPDTAVAPVERQRVAPSFSVDFDDHAAPDACTTVETLPHGSTVAVTQTNGFDPDCLSPVARSPAGEPHHVTQQDSSKTRTAPPVRMVPPPPPPPPLPPGNGYKPVPPQGRSRPAAVVSEPSVPRAPPPSRVGPPTAEQLQAQIARIKTNPPEPAAHTQVPPHIEQPVAPDVVTSGALQAQIARMKTKAPKPGTGAHAQPSPTHAHPPPAPAAGVVTSGVLQAQIARIKTKTPKAAAGTTDPSMASPPHNNTKPAPARNPSVVTSGALQAQIAQMKAKPSTNAPPSTRHAKARSKPPAVAGLKPIPDTSAPGPLTSSLLQNQISRMKARTSVSPDPVAERGALVASMQVGDTVTSDDMWD